MQLGLQLHEKYSHPFSLPLGCMRDLNVHLFFKMFTIKFI